MSTIERIDYKNQKKKTSDFEIVDLQLFFATRPKTHLLSDYRLNFWAIIYIFEGCGHHYIDFQEFSYKPGDIIFVQKNQVHHFEVNSKVKGYIIHINEPFFYKTDGVNGDSILEFVDKSYGSPIVSVDTNMESTNRMILELIYKEYNKYGDTSNYKLIASLFQSFVFAIQSLVTSNDSVFNSKAFKNFDEFRRLLEANYMEHRTVEEYSNMMNLSKKTINQSTRLIADLSAKQFINNRLLLEIKRYLSQGDLMNYEIADLLGFDEAANMTKFFKRYEGISPKEFRKSLAE